MSSILGIVTGRISDQYVYQQMTAQLDAGLTQLTQLETELSTGDQFQLPSQDPVAAQQVISLTSLSAKKQQAQSNLTSAQSYLSEADSAMTNINNLMSQARATGVAPWAAQSPRHNSSPPRRASSRRSSNWSTPATSSSRTAISSPARTPRCNLSAPRATTSNTRGTIRPVHLYRR